MQLVKAERHQSWRCTERSWRVWVRWVRTKLAEAASRAHEESMRRAHAADMLATGHFRRVSMRVTWDHIVCAVNILRQESLIAAEQARRQEAANRLLAHRKPSFMHAHTRLRAKKTCRLLAASLDNK